MVDEDDALAIIRNRNNFYRDNYRRVVLGLLLMVLINLGLVGVVFFQIYNRPTPQYFATTAEGRIIPLYPLNSPMVSQTALLQWANQAALAVYSYDFLHWNQNFQEASAYFTEDGWSNFEQALKASRTLETVIDKKLVVTAVATGAPRILEQGVINGRYTWKVQIPMLASYVSASTTFQQPLMVTLLITRVSILNNPQGIAIAQFFASPQQAEQGASNGASLTGGSQ